MRPHFLGWGKVGRNSLGTGESKDCVVAMLNERCVLGTREAVACISLDLVGEVWGNRKWEPGAKRGRTSESQEVVGWRGERTTLFDLLDLAMPEACHLEL